MENEDTIFLLQECDAGIKMAISSIEEVLDKVKDLQMKTLLEQSKLDHDSIGNQIHGLLAQYHGKEKEPNPIAKGMSWVKTNWKMGMEENDGTVADLMTDGCNMGVKSLSKYKNQYPAADESATELCDNLIKIEEKLAITLRKYL